MSDTLTYPVRHILPAVKRISGRFFPQGAGAVNNTQNRGGGFTVTRTAKGVFQVVFDGAYKALLDVQACTVSAGADFLLTRVTEVTDGPSQLASITITTQAVGGEGPAAYDPSAGESVSFSCDFTDLEVQ